MHTSTAPTTAPTPLPTPVPTPEPTASVCLGGNACDLLSSGKPNAIKFRYVQGSEIITAQAAGSYGVVGDTGNASPVRVYITAKAVDTLAEALSLPAAQVYANTVVTLGGEFGVSQSARLGPNMYLLILDMSGNVLEKSFFHTSCSQPLRVGDRYGSLQIVELGFVDNKGHVASDSCAAQQTGAISSVGNANGGSDAESSSRNTGAIVAGAAVVSIVVVALAIVAVVAGVRRSRRAAAAAASLDFAWDESSI